MLYPLVGLLIIYGGIVWFFLNLRQNEWLQKRFFRIADAPDDLRPLIAGCLLVAVAGIGYDLVRRYRAPRVPTYLRVNRALLYAFSLVTAWNAWTVTKDTSHLQVLAYSNGIQLLNLAALLLLTTLFFFAVLWPLADDDLGKLPPYQRVVASLVDTYDFVLGIEYPNDWKKAEKGGQRWAIWKEKAIWQNLFALGAIGTGKTATLLFPLIMQALSKFPGRPELVPSMVILDLKGDLVERIYELCVKLGRADDFIAIRPGNCMLNADGSDIVPRKHFWTYDALGASSDPADVRAELFSSGLRAMAQGETQQFWLDTEVQFLTATIQVFDAVRGLGQYSLFDIYMFAIDSEIRDKMVKSEQARRSPAGIYFDKYFSAFEKSDQMKLLSGLTAKLSRITNDATRSTFCAGPDSPVQAWTSFEDMLLNKSKIVVFSVPEATYSTELARMLGVMFMRAFHNAMLRRVDSVFQRAGGNTKRLVMLLVDECWAFMNPGVGTFVNVSRQARVMSVFLTQSIKAIDDKYRDAVLSGFLSKIVFPINDELTQSTMAKALGQYEETTTNVSTSESLNDAKNRVYTPGMKGKNQGVSRSVSTQKRTVDRFTASELKFQPRQRAVLQMGDGEVAKTPFAFETTPYFRLRYFLLHPTEHTDVKCMGRKGEKRRAKYHRYERATPNGQLSDGSDPGEVCSICGHELSVEARLDISEFRTEFPDLIPTL